MYLPIPCSSRGKLTGAGFEFPLPETPPSTLLLPGRRQRRLGLLQEHVQLANLPVLGLQFFPLGSHLHLQGGYQLPAALDISRELAVPYEEQLSRLELITKEILGLEKKEDRVMTAYEAGAYTVENFTKRMDPLRKQKAELEEKKAEAKRDLDRDAAIVANPQMVIDFARDMSKLIRHSQPKEKKELLKRFVKCVWIEPGRATIVCRIPLPSDGPNPGATKRELALPGGEPVSVQPTARGGPPTTGSSYLG